MKNKRLYFIILAVILLASFYPLYMGAAVLTAFFRNGGIDASDYPKYIIPYTPLCISIIASAALLPVVLKHFRKRALLLLSIIGVALFFAAELSFERIVVFEGMTKVNVEAWQLYMCVATPQVAAAVGSPLAAQYSPAFKVHFYLISIVVILAVINLVYGFINMNGGKDKLRKTPLIAQLVSVVIFVGLCILACFTAFYRTGSLYVSSVSAVLMSAFFITFGLTSGVYAGTILYAKKSLFSIIIPSVISALTTFAMYAGELVLTGGVLYRLGSGTVFEPLTPLPFAVIDFSVILLSGLLTCFILYLIKPKSV